MNIQLGISYSNLSSADMPSNAKWIRFDVNWRAIESSGWGGTVDKFEWADLVEVGFFFKLVEGGAHHELSGLLLQNGDKKPAFYRYEMFND